jgi:hypothetical protein
MRLSLKFMGKRAEDKGEGRRPATIAPEGGGSSVCAMRLHRTPEHAAEVSLPLELGGDIL